MRDCTPAGHFPQTRPETQVRTGSGYPQTGQSGGLRYRHRHAHPGITSPTDFGVFLG